jgi:hypothetical protein
MIDQVMFLYLGLVVFTITSLWVIIKTAKTKFLFFYIPAVVVLVTGMIFVYQSILGLPNPNKPPEKFSIIHFMVIEKESIFLWILKDGEKAPRSYVRPYTKKEHEELEKLREAVKGGRARGEQKKSGKKSNSTETSREEDEMHYYDFIEQIMREKQQ